MLIVLHQAAWHAQQVLAQVATPPAGGSATVLPRDVRALCARNAHVEGDTPPVAAALAAAPSRIMRRGARQMDA